MFTISISRLFIELTKNLLTNHLAVTVVGVLVLSLQNIIGCAPASTSGYGTIIETIDYDFNRPVDASSGVHPMIVPPPHDIGDDCNENGINDTYDRLGLFPRGPYPVADNGPEAIAAGDLNGDGLDDLAVAGLDDASGIISVTVLHQNDLRDFEPIEPIILGQPNKSVSIAIGDADGDSDQDIIVPSILTPDGAPYREGIILLQNTGDGENFDQVVIQISENSSLNRAPKHVIASNLDGGGTDLVAVSGEYYDNTMVTLIPNGEFNSPEHRQLKSEPHAITAAYLDDDSDLDLVVIGDNDADKIFIVINQNDSSPPNNDFSMWNCEEFSISSSVKAVETGDLNNDDLVDAIVVGTDGVFIFQNSGISGYQFCAQDDPDCDPDPVIPDCVNRPQRFLDEIGYEVLGATALSVVDVDMDDDLDVVLPVADDNVLTIMVNQDGTFSDSHGTLRVVNLPVQYGPRAIVAGDLDKDGRKEYAVVNHNSNDVWVIHSRPSPIMGPFETCAPESGSSPTTP